MCVEEVIDLVVVVVAQDCTDVSLVGQYSTSRLWFEKRGANFRSKIGGCEPRRK